MSLLPTRANRVYRAQGPALNRDHARQGVAWHQEPDDSEPLNDGSERFAPPRSQPLVHR